MESGCEVCIDLDVAGCTIGVKKESATEINTPVMFPFKKLFAERVGLGDRVSEAIFGVMKHCKLRLPILTIVCTTRYFDDQNNVYFNQDMEEGSSSKDSYKRYDLGRQLEESILKFTGKAPKIFFVSDSISACMDPTQTDRLTLTLKLGSSPILGLSQKNPKSTTIFKLEPGHWLFQLILSTSQPLSTSLRTASTLEGDNLTNIKLIQQAVVQVLKKYRQVYSWQPDCFVVFGGHPDVMGLLDKGEGDGEGVGEWPEDVGVRMKVVGEWEDEVKMQMRGALYWVKNQNKFKMT